MTTTYTRGLLAEFVAQTFLQCKLYKILYKRYKTPVGEIDLIGKKKNTIIFFEVKYRKTLTNDHDVVQKKQIHRIKNAASFFVARNTHYNGSDLRFDLLVISKRLLITHYQNVW